MLVYSPIITPRLHYVLQFLGNAWLGKSLSHTTSKEEALQYQGVLINYSPGKIRDKELRIEPCGLLSETGIRKIGIVVKNNTADKIPFFFETKGDYHFDIFSAIFYLISRYEEYLPHDKDGFGRYAHTNSLAWREGFLNRPLINEWINEFNQSLKSGETVFSSGITHQATGNAPVLPFTFLPTYDIDIAWSYKYKGFWRNAAGGFSELLRFKWKSLAQRMSVLLGKKPDPFDVFGWLNALHEKYGVRPYYFFLFAPKRGRYDKNIDPRHPAMRRLVYDHAIRYPVGVHPSWRSGDEPALLNEEIKLLSEAAGSAVNASRQHYIRMSFPATYRQLLAAGIRFDFSMGYGSINGFRASVALPFYWYDLEKEEATDLLVFPFCYMEANSYFEQHQAAEEGLHEMQNYYNTVKRTGGLFCMIWHNSFLTETGQWAEWRRGYENFFKAVK